MTFSRNGRACNLRQTYLWLWFGFVRNGREGLRLWILWGKELAVSQHRWIIYPKFNGRKICYSSGYPRGLTPIHASRPWDNYRSKWARLHIAVYKCERLVGTKLGVLLVNPDRSPIFVIFRSYISDSSIQSDCSYYKTTIWIKFTKDDRLGREQFLQDRKMLHKRTKCS